MSIQLETEGFDIAGILAKIETVGAASIRIIPENLRRDLLKEAKGYKYYGESSEEPGVVLYLGWPLREESKFSELGAAFEELLDTSLERLSSYPFVEKIHFNLLDIMRYNKNSRGRAPHTDGLSKNLICIFIIEGGGKFFVCSDGDKNNSEEINASPGNVILMKGIGFRGNQKPQWHYVEDITSTRYIFHLSQC